MKKHSCDRIGFKDGKLMLIMIPLLAFIIPIVFFGARFNKPVYYTWNIYLHTLLTTTVIWVGNRYIMVWSRNRYPDFDTVRKRLFFQSVTMLIFTVVATNVLSFSLKDFCDLSDLSSGNRTIVDILINANSTSLFCSLTIAAIYESRYFMNELRKSVEEKELLKRESLTAQIDALRTQINPHFLFNNLNTLSALIPEDPDRAVQFVQQLSKVYRHILEVKDAPSILLKDELNVLKAYAFLLQTRFGENLQIIVDIDEKKLTQKIAPLSLQLLLENAIKHNVVSADHPLTIRIFSENGKLVVSNNLQRKKHVAESMGLGLDNIRKRTKLLTDKLVEVIAGPDQFVVAVPLLDK